MLRLKKRKNQVKTWDSIVGLSGLILFMFGNKVSCTRNNYCRQHRQKIETNRDVIVSLLFSYFNKLLLSSRIP